ncbi:TIGR00730 family Rossman fold protein [Chitinibacteraceae bacterium HSL-7]
MRVAVFCGARHGLDAAYTAAARALGTQLAERGCELVYGGGHVGLMGEVADAARAAGGVVIGVIPHFMVEKELAHGGLSELIVVDSMHTRKARMAELADAFVALAGGVGTLDETFEIMTWAQLDLHRKPVAFVNTKQYYDTLLAFLSQSADAGFVSHPELDRLIVSDDVTALLDQLAERAVRAGEPSTTLLRERA